VLAPAERLKDQQALGGRAATRSSQESGGGILRLARDL